MLSVCRAAWNVVWFSLSQYKFIQYLLEGTKKLTPEFALSHNDTISHIISCGNGILLLSKKKCDIQTNPNPTVSSTECVTVAHRQSYAFGRHCVSYSQVVLHFFPPPVFVWGRLWDLPDNLFAVGFSNHTEISHQARNRHHLSEQVGIFFQNITHLMYIPL